MKKVFLFGLTISSMMCVTLKSQTTYSYVGSGALNVTSSWKDAGGLNPPDFTSSNQIFVLTNVSSTTLSAAGWTVSGTGSEVQIGNGSSSTNLTVASNATLMVNGGAKLRVRNNGRLTLLQSTMSNLPAASNVIIESGSTVNWAQSSLVVMWPLNYYNLIISNQYKDLNSNSLTTVTNSITTNNYLSLAQGSTLTIAGPVNGTLRLYFYNGASNSQLNITGTLTNSISIYDGFVNTQQLGGFNLSRPARVVLTKVNSANSPLIIGGNAGSSITSGTLDLSPNAYVPLSGSWNFGGGYITGSSNLRLGFGGTGGISGSILFDQSTSTSKSLRVLELHKPGQTLTLGNALDVYSNVNITAGTLNSNGNLTLKSNATQKARINVLGTSADVIGNVRVETFAKGGNTGWTNLAVAGVTGQTMASGWGDNFPMTCPSGCPNGSTAGGVPFTSVTTYNETNDTYPGISSGSNPITPGVGYWVYLGNGQYTTTDILIDVTGPIVKKAAGTWNITYSPTTNTNSPGWNLLGNPYPSPISFTKTFSSYYSSGKMANEVRVWNPDLNNSGGDYAIYKVGVGSTPPVSSGGIDDNIPMGQGFYIVASQGFSVPWTENFKTTTASTNPLLKLGNTSEYVQTNTPSQNRLFYLNLTGTNANAYAGIHFNNDATLNYNAVYDAEQVDPAPGAPQIFAVVNNKELKVKGLPYPNGNISIDIKVRSGSSGNYQIALQGTDNIPYGACITLYDKFTNTNHNLLSSPYSFYFSDTTTVARFTLKINMTNLSNLTTNIISTPLCHNQNTGQILADMNSGNYTFVWKDINNQIIRTKSAATKDTLKNANEGYYYLEVTDGNCSNITQTIQVVANVSTPVIDFTTNADTLPVNTPFVFSNNSQNLSNFIWYFGDGNSANTLNATHSYSLPGSYLVVLQGTNSCGDTLSIFKEVIVMTSTGLNPNGVPASPSMRVSRDTKGYFITANYTKDTKVNLLVTDIMGRTIIKNTITLGNHKKYYLENLPSYQIIVVRAEDGYNLMNQKIFVE